MTLCPTCGKPLTPRLVSLRLGLDEAPVELVCTCDSDQEDSVLSKAYALSSRLVETEAPQSLVSPRASVSDYVSDYEMHRRREHEIRLGPSLSEKMYKSLRTRATERKEMGVPISIMMDGCRLGARLRIRDDELPTMKVTLSRTRICPGMTLCSSLEVTVGYSNHSACDDRFSLTELVSTTQEYNVVIRSKVVSHQDWMLRCDYHALDGRYTAELSSRERTNQLMRHYPPLFRGCMVTLVTND